MFGVFHRLFGGSERSRLGEFTGDIGPSNTNLATSQDYETYFDAFVSSVSAILYEASGRESGNAPKIVDLMITSFRALYSAHNITTNERSYRPVFGALLPDLSVLVPGRYLNQNQKDGGSSVRYFSDEEVMEFQYALTAIIARELAGAGVPEKKNWSRCGDAVFDIAMLFDSQNEMSSPALPNAFAPMMLLADEQNELVWPDEFVEHHEHAFGVVDDFFERFFEA